MKSWIVNMADKETLAATLNWIEEQRGTVFQIVLFHVDRENHNELYRVVWWVNRAK